MPNKAKIEKVIDSSEDEMGTSDEELSNNPSSSSLGFSFVTDRDESDEGNILEDGESDASDSDEKNSNGEEDISAENEEKPIAHPFAHLFDEQPSKLNSSEKNSNDVPLSIKLLDGLTKNSKKRILPILKDSRKTEIDKLLAKSELLNTNMAEQTLFIEPRLSKRKLKKVRKEEREKTKGSKWFGLPAQEMTEEVKRDLEIMQMRSVLDPKHFYKKNHMKVLPKYFHIGKIEDTPLDFYNNRSSKKDRKKTLVDQLMSDAEFTRYNKTKYAEILQEKKKTHYKAWKLAKKLRRKNNV